MSTVEIPVRKASGVRWMLWIGRVLTLWPVFVVVSSATWKLTRNPWYVKEFVRIGWQPSALPLLACLQLGSLLLYLIPQTAVLGAILLTGYMGGAVASYIRIGDPFPLVVSLSTSIVAWFGIWFREERLRSVVPWRRMGQR